MLWAYYKPCITWEDDVNKKVSWTAGTKAAYSSMSCLASQYRTGGSDGSDKGS